MRTRVSDRILIVFIVLLSGGSAAAQSVAERPGALAQFPGPKTAAGVEPAADLPAGYAGPPPPTEPGLIARDGEGRAAIRAVRLEQPLRIDGNLDEPFYRAVPPISDFIQVEPDHGAPATERTEAWIAFDEDNVYVSFRNWDTDIEHLVATEMRRDSSNTWQGNDIISFIFDTFYDRRNSLTFTINPLGGRSDGQTVNERQYSADWNPVWTVKTGRFDGGWTIETSIPFKSIRYQPGSRQVWGFNAMRVKRSKNEMSTLTPVPASRGQLGVQNAAFAATLVGVEAPAGGRSLDFKPYLTGNTTIDRAANPLDGSDVGADIGFDGKYAITQNLTADFTYNTDFAQVEADEQQVNLTRFSLFFPEKRDFFLENSGTFSFGGVATSSFGGGGGGGNNSNSGDAPVLFYSRRIGLNAGRVVPLNAGGRVTGRAGKFTIGALNIQTGEQEGPESVTPSTNFSVLRLKRDVLRKSSIGLIATHRSVGVFGAGTNQAYGIDGTFGFFDNLFVNTYWSATRTDRSVLTGVPTLGRDSRSYRGQLDYNADRYGVQVERLSIGRDFNPELGFVRRPDMVRDFAQFRFSPRPRAPIHVRKYVFQGSLEYIENRAGRVESRERNLEAAIEFQNADRLAAYYTGTYEYLPVPSRIGEVELPVGDYRFEMVRLQYNMGQQRAISANLSGEFGSFYSGRKVTLNAQRGRINVSTQFSLEPVYSWNRVTLAEGRFTQHLAGSRLTYTMTPLMFVSALVQYNSSLDAVSTNARFRWEYQPGSELFIVYNEERNTLDRAFPALSNRAFIIKVTRLFRL